MKLLLSRTLVLMKFYAAEQSFTLSVCVLTYRNHTNYFRLVRTPTDRKKLLLRRTLVS